LLQKKTFSSTVFRGGFGVVLEWFWSESTLNFVVERASRALVFLGVRKCGLYPAALANSRKLISCFGPPARTHEYIRCVRCLTVRLRLM
jgi:hypothetical protein